MKDSNAIAQLSSGESKQNIQTSHLLSNDTTPQQLHQSIFDKLCTQLKGYENGESVLVSTEAGIFQGIW